MKFAAFISYSHTTDGELAPALQKALQRFAKPWNRRRALRIFRDETSLSINPALWSSIKQSLSESEYFILIASPDAAQSEWVQKEVDYWINNRPIDKLLIVLTEGDLSWDKTSSDFLRTEKTPLPPNLRGVFEEEPRYLDLRWARQLEDQLSLNHDRFRNAIADISATLQDRPKDELIGEDILQHKKLKKRTRSAVAALVILAVFVVFAVIFAINRQNEAKREKDKKFGKYVHSVMKEIKNKKGRE